MDLSIVIEQDALVGDLPSLNTIKEFMRQTGFSELDDRPFAWINREIGFAAFDARPANFVQIADTPIPFDLIIVPLETLQGLP